MDGRIVQSETMREYGPGYKQLGEFNIARIGYGSVQIVVWFCDSL